MPTRFIKVQFLVLLIPSLAAAQNTADWFVDPSGSDSNSGMDWANPFKTIQKAVDSASSSGNGDHIVVAQGTYTKGSSSSADNEVVKMKENVHIHGGFKGVAGGAGAHDDWTDPDGSYTATIIDGEDDETHVIFADNFAAATRTIVDGFKIKRGLADGTTDPTSRGGGVYVAGGDTFIRLENVTVTDNVADGSSRGEGGGIFHTGDESFELTKSVVMENYAETGAGLCLISAGDVNHIANTVFKDNGGLSVPQGKPTTLEGGAIYIDQANLDAMNCVFHDNEAIDTGGAIHWDPTNASDSDVVLSHCTFAFNLTDEPIGGGPDVGSGIHILGAADTNTMTIVNSILWDEGPSFDIFWGVTGGGAQVTLDVDNCDIEDSFDEAMAGAIGAPEFTAVISSDPLFEDAAARDLRLDDSGPVSPCIDTGLLSLLPDDLLDIDEDDDVDEELPWDLVRERRALDHSSDVDSDPEPDMGAYEKNG